MRKVKSLFLVGCAAMALTVAPAIAAENGATDAVDGGGVALATDGVTRSKTVVKVDDDLGEWRYGTGFTISFPVKKTVFSDMDHSSKSHRTSCEIDGDYDDSGWVKARTTSRSDARGDLDSTAYCYWDVQ